MEGAAGRCQERRTGGGERSDEPGTAPPQRAASPSQCTAINLPAMEPRVALTVLLILATSACLVRAVPVGSTTPSSASANLIGEDPLKQLAPTALKVLRECLSKEYSAMSCWKLFIVRRADGFIGELRTSEAGAEAQAGVPAVELLPGFVALEKDARRQDNEVLDDEEPEAKDDGQDLELDPGRDQESLDRALISRTTRLFSGRHVSVKVLPGVALKMSPRLAKDQNSLDADVSVEVGPGECEHYTARHVSYPIVPSSAPLMKAL